MVALAAGSSAPRGSRSRSATLDPDLREISFVMFCAAAADGAGHATAT